MRMVVKFLTKFHVASTSPRMHYSKLYDFKYLTFKYPLMPTIDR